MTQESSNKMKWLEEGKKRGATHVLDAVDTFNYEHFPVFVMPEDNLAERQAHFNNSEAMLRVYATYEIE